MSNTLRGLLSSVTFLCSLAACSSSASNSGPGDGGDVSGVDTQFCGTLEARSKKCSGPGSQGNPDYVTKCTNEWAGMRRVLLADFVAPLQQCLAQRECGVSDDQCFATVGKTAPPSAARDTYERTCLAKVAVCGKSVVSDDSCTDGDFPWRLVQDDVYRRLTPCFEAPACEEVSACLKREGEALGLSQ